MKFKVTTKTRLKRIYVVDAADAVDAQVQFDKGLVFELGEYFPDEEEIVSIENIETPREAIAPTCSCCECRGKQCLVYHIGHSHLDPNDTLKGWAELLNQSAQPCGCDPGATWVCERHSGKD